jgi:DnaJ like chaperone protein
MGWLGKVIGGTIGFAIGGPLGAVAGAVFGHGFDKTEQQYISDQGSALDHSEESQFTFFVASFSMLAKLTKADGRISQEELASIDTFMIRDLGLNAASRQVAIDIFNAATRSGETFEDYAVQFYNAFRAQPQIIELMVDILFRVAVADGQMSANEERLILSAVRIFNFSDEAYRRVKSRYVKEVNRYYAVLKCDENDSNDTIKRQYRRLVSEYHPDKIASKGLPEEFTHFAGDKFREIQEAYNHIKQQRGIK